MKKLIKLGVFLFTLLTCTLGYSQTVLSTFNGYGDINTVTGSGPTFTITVKGFMGSPRFQADGTWNGTDVEVGDVLWVDCARFVITNVNSSSYAFMSIDVEVPAEDWLLGVSSPFPNTRCAVVEELPGMLPAIPPTADGNGGALSGIDGNLYSCMFNHYATSLLTNINPVNEIIDYIGTYDVIPSVPAADHTNEIWKNSVGELYFSDGVSWFSDREVLLVDYSLEGLPTGLYKLGVDTLGVDSMYVNNNGIFRLLKAGDTYTAGTGINLIGPTNTIIEVDTNIIATQLDLLNVPKECIDTIKTTGITPSLVFGSGIVKNGATWDNISGYSQQRLPEGVVVKLFGDSAIIAVCGSFRTTLPNNDYYADSASTFGFTNTTPLNYIRPLGHIQDSIFVVQGVGTMYDIGSVSGGSGGMPIDSITFSGDVTGPYNNLQIGMGVVGSNELENTTVIPGTYAGANITVDSDGRITNASNGTGGAVFNNSNGFNFSQMGSGNNEFMIIATGIPRPTSTVSHGSPITWEILADAQHTNLFWDSIYASGATTLRINHPPVKKIYSFFCSPDETLAFLTTGAKATSSWAEITAIRQSVYGGYLTGNGSGWTQSPSGFLATTNYSAGIFKWTQDIYTDYSSISINYVGSNNYRVERLFSGLAGFAIGFRLVDIATNTAITTAPTSSDRVVITGGYSKPVLINPQTYQTVVSGPSNNSYYTGFANFWAMGVYEAYLVVKSQTDGTAKVRYQIDYPSATSYKIYRSTTKYGGDTLIHTGTTGTYIDSGGVSGTTYYYKLYATIGGVDTFITTYRTNYP